MESASSEQLTDSRLVCRACGKVHTNSRIVSTSDGREFGTYSEEWRQYCEAKWVLRKKRSKRTRQEYLRKVEELRGTMAAYYLREEMLKQWKHRQEQG